MKKYIFLLALFFVQLYYAQKESVLEIEAPDLKVDSLFITYPAAARNTHLLHKYKLSADGSKAIGEGGDIKFPLQKITAIKTDLPYPQPANFSYYNRAENSGMASKTFFIEKGNLKFLLKDDLLNFCLTNVYEKLSIGAISVLNSIRASRRKLSSAEILYLSDYETIEARKYIIELFKTTLISREIVDVSNLEEVYFYIPDFAKEFLSFTHPVDSEFVKQITRKSRELSSGIQDIKKVNNFNEFSVNALDCETPNQRIAAKLLSEALRFSKGNDYQNAFKKVNEAKSIDPNYYEVYRVGAFLKATKGDTLGAEEDYLQGLEIAPENPRLLYYYAQFLLFHLEDIPKALECADILYKIRPKHPFSSFLFVRCYNVSKEYNKAIQIIKSLISNTELDPLNLRVAYTELISLYSNSGQSYLKVQSDIDSGINHFKKSFEVFGTCVDKNIVDTKMLKNFSDALHTFLMMIPPTEIENNHNYIGNSLTFDWGANCELILLNDGFDLIVGNPPYVCSRNMDETTLELIKGWKVASSGHPDLYIPFFQIGIENLNQNGLLGYITVNTFTKSVNGRMLREYFDEEDINLTLINFGGEQVFHDRSTYTCICFIRRGNGSVHYIRTLSTELQNLDLNALQQFDYAELNHHDGWNLVNDQDILNFITKIESTGLPFKNLYNTRNGIATLKNDVYKFTPTHHDADFYYFSINGVMHAVEKGICRDIINANKIKNFEDLNRLKEKIIFPYDENTLILSEVELISTYPKAYAYLTFHRTILSNRDKGKGKDKYDAWYAYGRRQSMDINAFKLFFPHICERPTFVLCKERDLLFYNGIAIVSNDLQELLVIKKIMESELFYKYIKNTTKDYASGYISMSRNYLKNFGVPSMTFEQQELFLNSRNSDDILNHYYALNDMTEIAEPLIN
ncbi:MAG: hypothetical protein EOO19_03115 [Chryseobacterium sp.]|nr:MAG: hypothetical protein EOO19_03115 [Chryseobacterium sp.]